MAKVELVIPKMGESIIEATILKWIKKIGDTVEVDETILEIATDKVDSEVPSPVDGVIKSILFEEKAVVAVGEVVAIIEAKALENNGLDANFKANSGNSLTVNEPITPNTSTTEKSPNTHQKGKRFYSPLVRNIAKQETISTEELETIVGTGKAGRVTKHDILAFVKNRKHKAKKPLKAAIAHAPIAASSNGQVEIIEMDRMRRLIAEHMVRSKQVAPHVTSFIEVDVTNIVNWRKANKKTFSERYGGNLTYMPFFIEAIAKGIKDFPMVNVSVEGTNIILKKYINIGMATALATGNLIVPVIKNADHFNLVGLAKTVNDLANRARAKQLKPDEIKDGTFTITNVGTFGNLSGTPIINQPQVAIMAVGAIRKKPAVVETQYGDVIAIRQLMMMSLSYDHRVVDGFLGGSFLRRVADYLEAFDVERKL